MNSGGTESSFFATSESFWVDGWWDCRGRGKGSAFLAPEEDIRRDGVLKRAGRLAIREKRRRDMVKREGDFGVPRDEQSGANEFGF